MKKLLMITAFATVAATAVSCKSKAKVEPPALPNAAAVTTPDPMPAADAPITPADLGASSSGLGL